MSKNSIEGTRLQPRHEADKAKSAFAAEGLLFYPPGKLFPCVTTATRSCLLLGLIFLAVAGCHSRFVEATINNRGASNLSMIEIDYPSASFGVGNLAPNSQFHYRFKIQGSGPVKLEFTDAQGKTHAVDGPELSEGQEGSLTIAIDSSGKVTWSPGLIKAP